MKKYLHLIAIIAVLGIGAVLGGTTLSTLAQSNSWTAPTAQPPGGNVAAPINIGGGEVGNTYSQTKTGLLGLNDVIIRRLQVLTGDGTTTATEGQVLTAIDDNGTVGWRTPAISQSYTETFRSPGAGSWKAPVGLVGNALVKIWGSGAGGNSSCLGGSGGAGGYGELNFAPTVGTTYVFTIGQGGYGKGGYDNGSGAGAPPTAGTYTEALPGGSTIFNTSYIAYGGNAPSAAGAAGTGGSSTANLTNRHTGSDGTTGNNQYGGQPWGWVGAKTTDATLYMPGGGGASGSDDGVHACDGRNGIVGANGQITITYSISN